MQADPTDLQAGGEAGMNAQGLLLSQEKKIMIKVFKGKNLKNKVLVKMPTLRCSLNCELSREQCQSGAMLLQHLSAVRGYFSFISGLLSGNTRYGL